MTHGELVERAAKWLRNSKRCGVVVTEYASSCEEYPDAIGWQYGGRFAYMIECKTSMSDYYADNKKATRRDGYAMGTQRYYLTPPGLIRPDLLRDGWGLLEANPHQIRQVVAAAEHFGESRNIRQEMAILYSVAWIGAKKNNIFVYSDAIGGPELSLAGVSS